MYNGFQKNWSVQDWSPDDTKLLIRNFVSANEGAPLRDGHRQRRAHAGQRRRDAGQRLAGEVHGRRARRLLITNRDSEFEQLRRVDLGTGAVEILTRTFLGYRRLRAQ